MQVCKHCLKKIGKKGSTELQVCHVHFRYGQVINIKNNNKPTEAIRQLRELVERKKRNLSRFLSQIKFEKNHYHKDRLYYLADREVGVMFRAKEEIIFLRDKTNY